MTINVEQKHINKGMQVFPLFCPVALAIQEAIGKGKLLAVTGAYFRFYQSESASKYVYPSQEVSDRIRRFDSTGMMEPFSFELELP